MRILGALGSRGLGLVWALLGNVFFLQRHQYLCKLFMHVALTEQF